MRTIRLLRTKDHWKPKFKVGDVIRRKPLESYNYEQPIMKIAAIRDNMYIFTERGLALEIWAQDEWELYNTWWRKLWRDIKNWLSWVFRYQQPIRHPLYPTRHVGRMRKRAGLTLYKYNMKTGELERATVIDGTVMTEEGCIYRQALNKRNAIKKLRREGITK